MADVSNIGYTSIVTYLSFCLVFFTLKFVYFAEDSVTWIILFIVLSFILQLVNNISITADPSVCGTTNVTFAIYHTTLPWLSIFAVIALCLYAFPGWLRVFSNTFGLYAAQAYGLQEVINDIFKPSQRQVVEGTARQNMDLSLLKSIDNIYSNPTTIINELDPRTVRKMLATKDDTIDINKYNNGTDESGKLMGVDFKGMSNIELIEWSSLNKLVPTFLTVAPSQTAINQLYNMTLLKDTVGYFVWFSFVGVLCSMISVNSILSEKCNSTKKSVFDIIFNKT